MLLSEIGHNFRNTLYVPYILSIAFLGSHDDLIILKLVKYSQSASKLGLDHL